MKLMHNTARTGRQLLGNKITASTPTVCPMSIGKKCHVRP